MLELADVDYGSSGAFTINVWFRHDQENFEDFDREQFFGHGDPTKGMPDTNQVHQYFTKQGLIRTLLSDGSDPEQEMACDYCTREGLGYEEIDPATGKKCALNLNCWGPYWTNAETNPSEHGAIDNGHMWHMMTITTIPCEDNDAAVSSSPAGSSGINTCAEAASLCTDGNFGSVIASYCPRTCGTCDALPRKKGYSVYIDGQLRAGNPYSGAGWDNMRYRHKGGGYWLSSGGPALEDGQREAATHGGDPIDPVGPMRLCGRIQNRPGDSGLTQGHWGAQNVNGTLGMHPDRYFMGKVAHASFFSHAMTKEQVNVLMASYVKQYNLPVTPFDLPAGIEQPVAYYALNDGIGFDLKESVSGKIDAGKVIYDTKHQTVTYDQPNWVDVRRVPSTHTAPAPAALSHAVQAHALPPTRVATQRPRI